MRVKQEEKGASGGTYLSRKVRNSSCTVVANSSSTLAVLSPGTSMIMSMATTKY